MTTEELEAKIKALREELLHAKQRGDAGGVISAWQQIDELKRELQRLQQNGAS